MVKKQTATTKQPSSMAELLKTIVHTPQIKKGTICEGIIVGISKKEALFDIGWKTNAVLIQPETKELTTFLPYLKVGDKLPVRVISVEARAGFPVVSLQGFFEKGKWDILKKNFEKEELVEVNVIGSGKGGLFIEIMGIRGVIPKIQLTQNYITDPQQLYNQKIKVKILEVDKSKNRLVVSQKAAALGITQSKLTKAFEEIKEGQTVDCRVIGFSEFGIFCEVNGIEGLIHISEISWKKVTSPSDFAKQNEILKAVVLQKNQKDFKLTLSLKRLQDDPWKEIEQKYPKDTEVKGLVIRKEAYGYFVRLEPGVEGLIHNSKLPTDAKIELNTEIKAYVERIDKKHRKMSLVLMSTEKPLLYR